MLFQNDNLHLLDYWRVLSKRRYAAIIVFAFIVGVVTVYSFVATPVYKGSAQILINLEKNPTMTFSEGDVAYLQMKDSDDYFRTQIEILNSRGFADKVVNKLLLDKNPYYLEKKSKPDNGITNKIKDTVFMLFPGRTKPYNPFPESLAQREIDPELVDIILSEMRVETGKEGNIIKIHYLSENPNVAVAMANGIAAAYIEHNMYIRIKPFRDAVEWLSARMVELRAKVESSERTLQKYKEERGIASFETRENIIAQKLQELVSEVVKIEGRRQEAEIRYNQIKSVIDSPELLATVPDVMNNLVIQGLRIEELRIKKDISELSEKYGPRHPHMMKVVSELNTVQKNLVEEARKMLSAAKTEYEIAKSRETSLKRALDEQKHEFLDLSRKSIEFNVIAGESESNKLFYEMLLKKLQEASLSSGINISNAQIIDNAVTPKFPVSPRRRLYIFLAAIAGVFGGVFAAFFVDYLDDTIKGQADVYSILGLPFLGLVPAAKGTGPLYITADPRSVMAESFRTIRTSVILSSVDKPPKVIVITSTFPKEGKTTIASNLAVAMAQMGERVLLIDADMRKPYIDKVFGVDNSIGISNVIARNSDFPDAVRTMPDFPNLSILPGGRIAPDPSELLSSSLMKDLLNGLRDRFDRIIIDSPPLGAVSDPLILSSLADSVIMVIWGGVTGKDFVKKSVQSLKGVNAKILGVVINNLAMSKRDGYQYYYSYYSYSEGKEIEKTV